jgi:hypothetical protein
MSSRRSILPLSLLLAALVVAPRPGHALTHAWSHGYGGASSQNVAAVAADASGNVYIAGYYYGTTNFGGSDRTSAGGSDIILVKLDPAGAYLWDKTFGDATDGQYATAVSVDAAGNVYLAGAFAGGANFGGGALASAGLRDLFLAKFGPTGTFGFAKRFGDASDQQSTAMLVDYTDNVYWTGYFAGAVNFGGSALTSAGGNDAFLVKLDTAGAHLWSKKFGDAGDQRGIGLGPDHWGNIDLALDFTGSMDLGNGNITSAGNFDIGVVQYGAAGNYLWGGRFGDAAEQHATAVATEPFTGFLYVAGANSGTCNFGGSNITSAGGSDMFIAKWDCYGNHIWSDGWGDAANQTASALATDDTGFLFMAGTFEGRIDLGGGPLVSAGFQDVLLAGFQTNGTHALSRSYGDPSNFQAPTCLIEDASYNVIFGGGFQGTIDFGGSTMSSTAGDGFAVKFGPGVTPVREEPRGPAATSLIAQPNPFNPQTTLRYVVPARGRVRLDIYDLRGAHIATLFDRTMDAGEFTASWRGVRDNGSRVASGVYFARLTTAAGETTRKLVLLK